MKYSKILRFYILNPNCEVKSSNLQVLQQSDHLKVLKTDDFFYPNWQGIKLITNCSQLFT